MADRKNYPSAKKYVKGNTLFGEFDIVEYNKYSSRSPSAHSPLQDNSTLGILNMDDVSDFDGVDIMSDREWSTTRGSNKRGYVNCIDVPAEADKNKEWEQRRLRAGTGINFSDIIEDKTIDGRMANMTPAATPLPELKRNSKYTFEPIEMTGRSTTCVQAKKCQSENVIGSQSPSVEQILASSFAHNIRDLCTSFNDINKLDGRNSYSAQTSRKIGDGEQSGVASSNRGFLSVRLDDQPSFASDEFIPSEEMRSKMLEDEKQWQDEFGNLPTGSNRSSSTPSDAKNTKPGSKYLNITEFSGIVGDSDRYNGSNNVSMGNFFSTRCEDVREMIPTLSPRKRLKPVALLNSGQESDIESSSGGAKYSVASSSFYTDDELKVKSYPHVDNATYEKAKNSSIAEKTGICSISTIARHLNDAEQSPASVVASLMQHAQKTKTKTKQPSDQSNAILKPLGKDIMYITKPIPFEKPPTAGKIDILNIEEFYGNAPNWENFKKAAKIVTIADKPLKLLSSTRDNLPSNALKCSGTRQFQDIIENKENKRQNHTADTLSFDGSQMEFSDSSSIEFDSISEKNASSHRQTDGEEHTRDTQGNGDFQRPLDTSGKRTRSPSSNRGQIYSALGVHSIASAPTLAHSHATDASIVSKCILQSGNAVNSYNSDGMARQLMQQVGQKLSLPSYRSTDMLSPSRQHFYNPQSAAVPVTRSSSQCSNNSEYTQADGKFPLKANKGELVWNCTHLRSTVSKDFAIKNTAAKRLSLKIEVIGPGFQLVGIDANSTLVLHAGECRMIVVNFCPTVYGSARGRVIFKPLKEWTNGTNRSVSLFAYGGRTKVQLQGLERGTTGSSFLKMGDTSNLRGPMKRSFIIYNQGPLNGIAYIGTKTESGQHLSESLISIEPRKCVLRPNSYLCVRVTYHMRRKDLVKFLQKNGDVFKVGVVEVITGSEANRLRLASLLHKMGPDSELGRTLNFLVEDFPYVSCENFDEFGESVDNISEIFEFFKSTSFELTVNKTTIDETRDSERDLHLQISGIEESLMFRTIQPDQSFEERPQTNENIADNNHFVPDGTWSVFPTLLNFDQRYPRTQHLSIRNNFARSQTFQVDSNARHLFSLSMSGGCIEPGRECSIDVSLKSYSYIPKNVMLTVYIESGSIDIPVDIKLALPAY